MSASLDYKALRQQFARGSKANGMTPQLYAQRMHDRQARMGAAGIRARALLAHLHPDEYRSLYEQALVEVNDERGPLPGDDA